MEATYFHVYFKIYLKNISKIEGLWSQSDIKLPLYGRIIKLRHYILFVGKVSNGSISIEIKMSHSRRNLPRKRTIRYFSQKNKQYPALSKTAEH